MLAGCGASSDDRPAAGSTPTATATATHTPATAAARVPVTLTVRVDRRLTPPKVSVPARLPIQLTLRNRTPSPLRGAMENVPGELTVPAWSSGSTEVEALPKGRYEVDVRGVGSATVVVGVEPGP